MIDARLESHACDAWPLLSAACCDGPHRDYLGLQSAEPVMSELYYLYHPSPSPLPRLVADWIRGNLGSLLRPMSRIGD
jgi:hypothetical protein